MVILLLNVCSGHRGQSEFTFANKLAQQGLWKEAYIRWKKVLDSGQDSAALHNNMAIALEKMGKIEEAEKEYQNALKLSPSNQYIQRNLDRLKNKPEPKKDKEKGKKNEK
jgi:tetratricopeptide (TPR) repeat protein